MSEPVVDVNSLPMPASLSPSVPDPDSGDKTEVPLPSSHPDAEEPKKEAAPSVDNTKENCDDNHSTHSRSDEPAPKDIRETTINGSDKDSVNDDAVLDNRRDVGTRSSRSASPEYNPLFHSSHSCCSLWTITLRCRTISVWIFSVAAMRLCLFVFLIVVIRFGFRPVR